MHFYGFIIRNPPERTLFVIKYVLLRIWRAFVQRHPLMISCRRQYSSKVISYLILPYVHYQLIKPHVKNNHRNGVLNVVNVSLPLVDKL